MHTPWGQSQEQETVAEGITWVSTASHGGFHLDATRNKAFRAKYPTYKCWAGEGWFEEDCDAAVVMVAFPEHFTDQNLYNATRSLAMFQNPPIDPAVKARADSYETSIKGLWETGSYGGPGETKKWFCSFHRNGERKHIEMSKPPSKQFYTDAELAALD